MDYNAIVKRKGQLTPNQRAVIAFVTKNPDATLMEIGIACKLTPSNPGVGASKTLHNESVQAKLRTLMDRDPALQDEALLERLKDGLRAKKTDRLLNVKTGEVHEFVDEDMPVRHNYLKLALGVKGAMATKHEISGPNGVPLSLKELVLMDDAPPQSESHQTPTNP